MAKNIEQALDDIDRRNAATDEMVATWCYEHGCPLNDCASIHIEEDHEWRKTWERKYYRARREGVLLLGHNRLGRGGKRPIAVH